MQMNMSSRVSTWERQTPVNYCVQQGVNRVSSIQIDSLPLRKGVCKEFAYHNVNGVSTRKHHLHGFDSYDNAKLLSSMASRKRKPCVNQVRQQWCKIIVNNGEYECKVKSSHVLSKCQQLVKRGVKFEVVNM